MFQSEVQTFGPLCTQAPIPPEFWGYTRWTRSPVSAGLQGARTL